MSEEMIANRRPFDVGYDEPLSFIDDRPQINWFDSEVYDEFGEELGQNGLSVYMVLVFCVCSHRKRSLRQLAATAQMAEELFEGTLKRVVEMGLVSIDFPENSDNPLDVSLIDMGTVMLRRTIEADAARAAWLREQKLNGGIKPG